MSKKLNRNDGQNSVSDFENAHEQFSAVSSGLDRVALINEQFTSLIEDVSDTAMRAIAGEVLITKQSEALGVANNAYEVAPYAQLFAAHDFISGRLEEVEAEKKPFDQELDSINTDFERAVELVPEASDRLADRAVERKQMVMTQPGVEQIFRDYDELATTQQRLNQLVELAGKPWPIPQVSRFALVASGVTIEQLFTDEIPVEPVLGSHTYGRNELTKNRITEAKEATNQVIEYLADNPNQVVTVEDLEELLYGRTEAIDGENLRGRVTTLMGPKLHGKIIAEMLRPHGLSLQYGWRTTHVKQADGSLLFESKRRIYRVLNPSDTSTPIPTHITHIHTADEAEYTDVWHATIGRVEDIQIAAELDEDFAEGITGSESPSEVIIKKTKVEKPNASVELAEIFEQHIGREFTIKDLARLLYADSKEEMSVLTNRVNALIGQRLLAGYLSTAGLALEVDKRPTVVERSDGKKQTAKLGYYVCKVGLQEAGKVSPDESENLELGARDISSYAVSGEEEVANDQSAEKKQEWEQELKFAVGHAISELEKSNIVFSGSETIKTIRNRLASRRVLTVTGVNQAKSAGILAGKENDRDIANIEITMSQLVAMILLKNPYLGKGQKHDRALEIVDTCVQSFLDKYKKR